MSPQRASAFFPSNSSISEGRREDEGINRVEQLLVLRHALEHHTLEQKERLVITPHARNDGKTATLA